MDDLVNKRVRALAADHGLTVPETLAAELDQLQQAFRDKALEDRDVGSCCFCSRLPSCVRPCSA